MIQISWSLEGRHNLFYCGGSYKPHRMISPWNTFSKLPLIAVIPNLMVGMFFAYFSDVVVKI